MVHINYLKKDPTKIKARKLKKSNTLKDNGFIDNKLYYLEPIALSASRFYDQPKLHKSGVPIRPIASCSGSMLYNLKQIHSLHS